MKVKLTSDNLIDFLAIYNHCELRQYVSKQDLEKFTEITCNQCGEPVMFRGSNGLWYYANNKVFD